MFERVPNSDRGGNNNYDDGSDILFVLKLIVKLIMIKHNK